MADLTPNNREEYWLQGMVDGQTTLEPNKRREYWYKEIVDAIGSGGGGGTGGGVLMINVTSEGSTFTMDKTYAEIKSAFMGGLVICIISSDGGHSMALVTFVYDDEEECYVDIFNTKYNTRFEYICSSVNDYPVYVENK